VFYKRNNIFFRGAKPILISQNINPIIKVDKGVVMFDRQIIAYLKAKEQFFNSKPKTSQPDDRKGGK